MKNIFVLIFLCSFTIGLCAKKVICVDGCNSGFVNNHEGYERSQAGPGDTIQVGGSLMECLAKLTDGDTLIIIAHSTQNGSFFIWGGASYIGFGDDLGHHPVPKNFEELKNITVEFCSCFSEKEDGDPFLSLVDQIIIAMGGLNNGHVGMGFKNFANAPACTFMVGGTLEQKLLVKEALKDNTEWMNNPPINRPTDPVNPVINQAVAANLNVVYPVLGNFDVVVIVTGYKKPVNSITEPSYGANGCGCLDPPGCGFGTQEIIFASETPTLSQWGLILLTLFLITLSTVVILRKQSTFEGVSGGNVLATTHSKVPLFEPRLFWKLLPKVLLFVPLLLIVFYLAYGFITTADIFGTLISAGIITYILHFILLSNSNINKELKL